MHAFHVSQCRLETNWTLEKTSIATSYSLGSVSQYVLIGSWYRTHEKQLRRCHSLRDALKMIRDRQRDMKLGDV